METHPGEGVVKEKFSHSRKPSHRCVCGEFRNLRGQHKQRKKTNNNNKPQNICLTATAIGEVTQMLASATSERGLDWEAQVAS